MEVDEIRDRQNWKDYFIDISRVNESEPNENTSGPVG